MEAKSGDAPPSNFVTYYEKPPLRRPFAKENRNLPESTSSSEKNEKNLDESNDDTSDRSNSDDALSSVPSKTELVFEEGDPDNPYNWSYTKRAIVVFIGIVTVLNSTIGSSLPSGAIEELSSHFGVTNDEQLVLPNSIFLVGYVVGPLLFGPLSESHGRQWVMIGTFGGYTAFTLGTCLAPNYAGFIVFRLFCGVFASSPISVIGGLYADLYDNPTHRGRAMAVFMTGTVWGPLIGPVASGYLGVYSWQWPFWFGLIFAGVSWIPLLCLPETFGPIILKRRAQKMRKQNPGANIYAPIELEHTSVRDIVTKVLTRPFRMFFTEAIVLFTCLFLCLIYAIFYMFFQVYPIIFPPIYGFSYGEEGLTFLPIGVGAGFACAIYLWWDHYLGKAKARNATWADSEEYRRLPLGCIGGPFFCIAMFWIGWTARESIHWIVPTLSGIPFGIGFLLLFMSLINYIVDAYEIYAASAMAAASCSRSVFGAVLPLAGLPMFETLGIAWACSLLGFLSLSMCVIPFIFVRYGDRIRARSKFCQELQQKKKEMEQDEEKRQKKAQRSQRRESQKSAAEA